MLGAGHEAAAMSTTTSPLISAEALAERLGEPALVCSTAGSISRIRTRASAPSRRAHLRVQFTPISIATWPPRSRPMTGRHPLPPPRTSRRAFELGLGARRRSRLRRGQRHLRRAAVVAAALGRTRRVAVLDGGFKRWRPPDSPVNADTASYPPGDFVAHPRSDLVVDARNGAARRHRRRWRLLDARAPERFAGEVEPIDPVAGHVPGAAIIRSRRISGRGRPVRAGRSCAAASRRRSAACRRRTSSCAAPA